MNIREKYISKQARDARYKELTAKGLRLIRGTTGPCHLHPEYVKDFSGPEKLQTGFGNVVYKTFFKQLYTLEQTYED